VIDAELLLQLVGDVVLTVLWVIFADASNEVDVRFRDGRSPMSRLRSPPPPVAQAPLSPAEHGFRLDDEQ
jgi:hypothetical protein